MPTTIQPSLTELVHLYDAHKGTDPAIIASKLWGYVAGQQPTEDTLAGSVEELRQLAGVLSLAAVMFEEEL